MGEPPPVSLWLASSAAVKHALNVIVRYVFLVLLFVRPSKYLVCLRLCTQGHPHIRDVPLCSVRGVTASPVVLIAGNYRKIIHVPIIPLRHLFCSLLMTNHHSGRRLRNHLFRVGRGYKFRCSSLLYLFFSFISLLSSALRLPPGLRPDTRIRGRQCRLLHYGCFFFAGRFRVFVRVLAAYNTVFLNQKINKVSGCSVYYGYIFLWLPSA